MVSTRYLRRVQRELDTATTLDEGYDPRDPTVRPPIHVMPIITKREARDRLWEWYYTGKRCCRGHLSARRVKPPSACPLCNYERNMWVRQQRREVLGFIGGSDATPEGRARRYARIRELVAAKCAELGLRPMGERALYRCLNDPVRFERNTLAFIEADDRWRRGEDG